MTDSRGREINPGWIAVGVLAFVALLLLFFKASETVAPTPVAAWVAIRPEGAAAASIGGMSLPAGSPFELYAVVEAETFRGGRIYYTEAEALVLSDGETVSPDALRRWDRAGEVRILWFTVDGLPPYREVSPGAPLGALEFKETFRSDWAQAWKTPGDLRPAVENFLPDEERVRRESRFGVQRFHVRMEFFEDRGDLVPRLRLRSWGVDQLAQRGGAFPSVVANLPGSLVVPSRVFGLSQVEFVGGGRAADELATLADWTRTGLAFSRLWVLAEWLKAEGVAFEDLVWSDLELGVSDQPARPGDLLRVGNRIVWVLEDRGQIGRLDYEDLCLDFDRGARVRRLGTVFTGEGLVEWAPAPSA